MPIELPPLPWEKDALQPHISKETIEYHYGKVSRVGGVEARVSASDTYQSILPPPIPPPPTSRSTTRAT